MLFDIALEFSQILILVSLLYPAVRILESTCSPWNRHGLGLISLSSLGDTSHNQTWRLISGSLLWCTQAANSVSYFHLLSCITSAKWWFWRKFLCQTSCFLLLFILCEDWWARLLPIYLMERRADLRSLLSVWSSLITISNGFFNSICERVKPLLHRRDFALILGLPNLLVTISGWLKHICLAWLLLLLRWASSC